MGQQALAVAREPGRQVHLPGGGLEAEAVVVALATLCAAKVFRPLAPEMTALLNQFACQHSAKAFLLYRHLQPEAGPVEYYRAKAEGYATAALRLTLLDSERSLALVQFAGEVARSTDTELSRLAQADLSRPLQTQFRPLAVWVFCPSLGRNSYPATPAGSRPSSQPCRWPLA